MPDSGWRVRPQVDGADRVYWIVENHSRRMGWAFDRENEARECSEELNRYRDGLVMIAANRFSEPFSAKAADDVLHGRSIE